MTDYRFTSANFSHAEKHKSVLVCPLCGDDNTFITGIASSENSVKVSMTCGNYRDEHTWDILIESEQRQTVILSRDTRKPSVCQECGVEISRKFSYCKSCYDKTFYNGVPLQRCSHILKSGNRCAQKGHLKDGLCWLHKPKAPP